MIDFDHNRNCIIYNELSDDQNKFWFDFKQRKFLHNVDTFYYSVKLKNDFTSDSTDPAVLSFRSLMDSEKRKINYSLGVDFIDFSIGDLGSLLLCRGSFSNFYNIRLSSPDEYDIFFSTSVPKGSGSVSVTPEIIVQLRSYFIWCHGLVNAFERSLDIVKHICKIYGFSIDFVQENRVDFCWHSNYFLKPSSFFNSENFYKMRVSRYSSATSHTFAVGSEGFEVDYLALGKRGNKCFIRIYHKSKEVIEMGYKSFFFKIWLMNGLINRYDFYCYEAAFLRKSFKYLDIARLRWYVENGSDQVLIDKCQYYIDQYDLYGLVGDDIISLADKCTPKLNTIVNVEFQTMRKASKSFCLVPFHHNYNVSHYGVSSRIYDYFDNIAIICEYLTRVVLRLVSGSDKNKSRRDYCPFWAALRHAKLYDNKRFPDHVRLVREYNRNLNEQVCRKRAINSLVRAGFYQKGKNEDSVKMDIVDFISTLNDNDFAAAQKYKNKQLISLGNDFDEYESKITGSGLSLLAPDGTIICRDYADEVLNDCSMEDYFDEDE
ncbi:MAG: hypothetical protein J5829_10605 [Lachnospiraceae bacterium]|nr:hypothetical protein [Lachnospiraceae bacterium]